MTDASRAVVITGAAGDLCRALGDSFLADGFTVYAADRAPPPPRPSLEAVTRDVTDRAAVIALAERAGRESDWGLDQRRRRRSRSPGPGSECRLDPRL